MKDITGQKYYKLTFIEPLFKDKDRAFVWLAQCDCGNFTKIKPSYAKGGQR